LPREADAFDFASSGTGTLVYPEERRAYTLSHQQRSECADAPQSHSVNARGQAEACPPEITLPPNSAPTALIALARNTAAQQALDPALVCAIVEQESAWDPHAIRYEPAFRTRYVAPLGLPPTEEVARSISWGLMQVMGQVAREHGFAGKSLAALCEPAAGLAIGCAVFAAKLRASADDVQRTLTLWNGGANAAYAAQVLTRLAKYR
jgi:soluble lytic murein transglycosylase-like protein